MISVKDNYDLVNDLASKNNGVFISPEEYNRYATLASNELFDELRGAKNRNVSTYGRSRTLDSRLNPFRKTVDDSFINYEVDKEEDYVQALAMYDSNYLPIKPIDEDRLARLHQNPLAQPDEEELYYIERVDKFELLATQGDISFTLEYLKKPVSPDYKYTIVNNRPVFNPTGSVNFEWDKNMEMELTTRILSYLGISMKDGFITQVTNNSKAQE